MARPIPQAYRGSEADRWNHDGSTLPLLKQGEFFWTEDNKQLWSGDGAETGGVRVGTSVYSVLRHKNPLYAGPVVATGQASTATTSLGANQAIAVPVCITERDRLTAVYVQGVAGGANNQTAKLGVFSTKNGKPHIRIDDGNVATYGILVNGTGMFTPAAAFTQLWLPPGVYWAVAVLSTVTASQTSKIAKFTAAETISSLGFDTSGNKITHLHYTGGSYASGVPTQGDTFESGSWTAADATTGCPALFLQFV